MRQLALSFLVMLGGVVFAIAAATGIVAWWPRLAESIASQLLSWKSFVAIVLFVFVLLPSRVMRRISTLALFLCVAVFAIAVGLGVTLFPAEMRGGKKILPRQEPPTQKTLADRLREPWSNLAEECPPAGIDMARCSHLVYDTPGQWKKLVPKLGFEDHVPIVQGCAKAVVMTVGDEAVIAFQGTDDTGDWLVNLDKNLAPPPADPVHGGFLKAYQSVAGQVHDALKEYSIRHVWITGHSLGGAMAVLCAIEMTRAAEIDVRGVITFGQPLLLAPAFAVEANRLPATRHMRFINEDDVVPRIVPGFRGGGSAIWFRNGETEFIVPRMRAAAVEADQQAAAELDVEDGPTPLTDDEFEAKKAGVKAERARRSKPILGEPVNAMALPTSEDHPMDLYLHAIETAFGRAAAVAPASSHSATPTRPQPAREKR